MTSKDNEDKKLMHSKSNNTEITTGQETGKYINEFFESIHTGYQPGLDESLRDGDFIFGSIGGMT